MIIEVDTTGPVPPYEQIRVQVATMIATGTLAPGTRLPTVRQLASDLGLAVNTVARAYRELETAGLVVGRVRHGTVVADQPPTLPAAEVRRRLADAARAYALAVRQLGVPAGMAERAVREQLASQPAAPSSSG